MHAFTVLVILVVISVATSFTHSYAPARSMTSHKRFSTPVMMSEEKKYEIVPLETKNVQDAATATGGILGLVLGGPILGLFMAAIVNYVSKKEGDSGEAFRGLGKTIIEASNYLNKINTKYDIFTVVGSSVTKAVSSIDKITAKTAFAKAGEINKEYNLVSKGKQAVGVVGYLSEQAIDNASTALATLDEINKEYNLVSKGKQALGVAGNLSEQAIDKVLELNEKYDFVDTAKKAIKTVVDSIF